MIQVIQTFIVGFCFAGAYGLSYEWEGPPNEPRFFITFIVLCLISFALVTKYHEAVKDEILTKRNKYDNQDHVRRLKRIKAIEEICNANMATAEGPRKIPIKQHVVMSYEDLLKIWDHAERMKYSE